MDRQERTREQTVNMMGAGDDDCFSFRLKKKLNVALYLYPDLAYVLISGHICKVGPVRTALRRTDRIVRFHFAARRDLASGTSHVNALI